MTAWARNCKSFGRSRDIQNEINGILWKACDTFRGTVDPAEYKNYILVMLFVKYISDVWQDHYEAVKKEYGDDEARILRRMKRERFVLPPSCTFQSLYQQRNAANLGEVINQALDAIEDANNGRSQGSVAQGENSTRPRPERRAPSPVRR